MKTGSIIAIYFVTWWITLFTVLPFGIKNAHEAGQKVKEGEEPGAPIAPNIGKKALINSVIAGVVTALVVWAVSKGALSYP